MDIKIDYVDCDNCDETGAITNKLYDKFKNKLQKIKCWNCDIAYNNIDEDYTHKFFA
jgi:hypothetical protein